MNTEKCSTTSKSAKKNTTRICSEITPHKIQKPYNTEYAITP